MSTTATLQTPSLQLPAVTAADIMSSNPLSIRELATLREALALLTDTGFSVAPVINEAGRPVGVLSRANIVAHDRECVHYLDPMTVVQARTELAEALGERPPGGFQVEDVDDSLVRDIMTPFLLSVRPTTPVATVVEKLLDCNVHHLFVVDDLGVLVGIISTLDVLRQLQAVPPPAARVSRPLAYEPW